MGADIRCGEIHAALSGLVVCEETTSGARLATHCLYPSFEAVRVFVAKFGDGYKVHDDGGAYREAWLHGRDDALISRIIKSEASRCRLAVSGASMVADVPSAEWLASAILTVSNASASAARKAVERIVKKKRIEAKKRTTARTVVQVGYLPSHLRGKPRQ
jgi:hypothetical protein